MSSVAQSLRDARHVDKGFYVGSDERFYEPNYAHYNPDRELISLISPMLDKDNLSWKIHRSDVWTHIIPISSEEGVTHLPRQGWKVHISATNINCRDLLIKVSSILIPRGIQFKFANDVETLRLMTSKRWRRGGSGKFITVYPKSEAEFRDIIECLYVNTKYYVGSYILSDRRYKDSRCIYYRYGSIIPITSVNYLGQKDEILLSPDGQKVVDQRRPYFELPYWVSDPYPEENSDQDEMTLNEGRFTVKGAIAFSNTGGVYLAEDMLSGQEVIVKEARPGVELSSDGKDATERLAHEAKMLGILDDQGIVPKIYATFWDWENFYLVEEYLDSDNIRIVMLKYSPLLKANPDRDTSEQFYKIYKKIFISLLKVVDKIHTSGVVFGDLAPTNVMVDRTTMTVRLIDLEGAFRPGVDDAQDIHTLGFRDQVKGRKKGSDFRDDIYAIGVMMMYSMFPIAAMQYLREDLYSKVLPVIVADIGWSGTPVLKVIQGLIGNAITCRDAVEMLSVDASIASPYEQSPLGTPTPRLMEICGGLARFITSNYRLKDVYTLFPVDPYGRNTNPSGFAFGATGIIYSLLKCGFEVPQEAMCRFRSEILSIRPADIAPGFLVGAAGMAWALMKCGELDVGRSFMQIANSSPLLRAHHSLYHGMAGIGMANLAFYLATGEQSYRDAAFELLAAA